MQPPSATGMSYGGVWLGKVKAGDDAPLGQRTGRLRVEIPDVYGENIPSTNLPWAYPLLPGYVSPDDKAAAFFAIPPVGARVGILFERGDPQSPRWIGGWVQKGKLPFQLQFSEGDKYPNIEAWRTVDGAMIRFVVGEKLEIFAGQSGSFDAQGKFMPDGNHNEHDTFLSIDKKHGRVTFRSKFPIDIQSKDKITFKCTGMTMRIMPNQESDGEGGWQNAEGSSTPKWELSVIDPEAGQGARITAEPGKLRARSRSVSGFKDS